MLNMCHIGDCRDLLKQMATAGVRVQMCVTSPPYFGLRDYGHADQIGLETSPAGYVDEMVSVFAAVRDVLADDGTLWLNLGDSYAGVRGYQVSQTKHRTHQYGQANRAKSLPDGFKAKDLIGIPWRVALALQADGWYLRSDIIWHKPNPMPESVTDRPTKAHEYLFLLAKSERYYYDAKAIAEPATMKPQNRYTNGRGEKDAGYAAHRKAPGMTDPEDRNRRTVWSIPTQPFDGAHFATFPPALVEPCIMAGSRTSDVVLDPFMGSGTTAHVAEHLGRQWIGCEINPDYAQLQTLRLSQRAMVL